MSTTIGLPGSQAQLIITPRPRRIAVFGAGGHIGGPLAEWAGYVAPDVSLRLLTSSAATAQRLGSDFPAAEVVQADLLDRSTLDAAVEGADGIFVVTPAPFDEATAMTNLVDAVRAAGVATHIVRIVGFEAESSPERVPASLREYGGTAQQHYIAKRILAESGLPVTFLNIGATYMDNLLSLAPGVRSHRQVIWPERVIPFIDPRDVGEIAANLLLSEDGRHIDQFYTVNNGHDVLTTQELVATMSDVLRMPIALDTRPEAFVDANRERLAQRRGRPDAAERILEFILFEQRSGAFLQLNDFAQRMLGRAPITVRAWLLEHRAHFLPGADA